jgi:hypothetical protein
MQRGQHKPPVVPGSVVRGQMRRQCRDVLEREGRDKTREPTLDLSADRLPPATGTLKLLLVALGATLTEPYGSAASPPQLSRRHTRPGGRGWSTAGNNRSIYPP